MAGATKIEILPCRSVTIDGQLYGPGEVVSVPAKDAATLEKEGYAKKA